jgi:hypothetical protein
VAPSSKTQAGLSGDEQRRKEVYCNSVKYIQMERANEWLTVDFWSLEEFWDEESSNLLLMNL